MSLYRALATISGLTLLSRVTGLLREILFAHAFGASALTDAFNIAFRIPNLLRRLSAEGAFSQAFIPILAEFKHDKGNGETKRLIDAMATVLTWSLVVITFVGIIGASFIIVFVATGLSKTSHSTGFEYTVLMTRIMFPYVLLISLTSFASAILNSYKQFSVPAFSPVLLNLSFIGAILFVAPYLNPPILALSIAVVVGGILQLGMQLPALKRLNMLPRISTHFLQALAHSGVKRVLAKMLPASFAVSVAQISLLINTNIASRLTPGSVSWLSYADRLMELPTALIGVALSTLLLSSLSRAYAKSDFQAYSLLLDWGLRLIFLLAAPASIALIIYAEPLIATIFNYGQFLSNDVVKVALALKAYGVGLLGLILIKVLASGFYAQQNIKTPVKVALMVVVCTQIGNLIFVPYFSHAGLALSIALGACINALLLLIGLRYKKIYIPQRGWRLFFIKITLACLIMGLVLYWFANTYDWIALGHTPWWRVATLCISLIVAGLTYFIVLIIFGFRLKHFKHPVEI